MADIQTLKKLLAEEYGITTARELDEAMKKIGGLNIGVFASPVRKDGTKHEKYAVLHEPGDIVTLAGTRFVVLDVERRGSLPDSLFLLALESVGASEFGSSNNYGRERPEEGRGQVVGGHGQEGPRQRQAHPPRDRPDHAGRFRLLWEVVGEGCAAYAG